MLKRGRVAAGFGVALALSLTGCWTGWSRSGKGIKDLVDFGITTSKRFGFAFTLPGDYFNFSPTGYANVEGTFHGIGGHQIGAIPIHNHSWGLLLVGSRRFQLGEFHPEWVRHLSPRQVAALKAEGKPMPTETYRYNTGVAGMLCADNIGNRASFYT